MKYVTIQGCRQEDQVAVEVRDMDTNGVGGYVVSVSDLWGWLDQCRPCVVQFRERRYTLHALRAAARYQRAAVMYI